jgi:6-phosphogluconolactonase
MNDSIQSWDDRRDWIVPGDAEQTIAFAAEHWIHQAKRSIQQRGRFAVALSGGSTPKAIYEKVTQSKEIDWKSVWLFWSDERAVPPDHTESNYQMAMASGFSQVPIPPSQIFRMKAESDLEKNALEYEEVIKRHLGKHYFDLVMLGIGEDGHTASLFPETKALTETDRIVVSNWVPKLNSNRMTLTFTCINQSFSSALYAIGPSKRSIVIQALEAAIVSPWPASRVGTPDHKTLWILDQAASAGLFKN